MRPSILPLLCTALLFVAANIPPAPGTTDDHGIGVALAGNEYTLHFDHVTGERLEDLLLLAQELLDMPVKYNPAEVSDVRIRIVGPAVVSEAELRGFIETVLYMYDFLLLEESYGQRRLLQAVRVGIPTRGPGARIVAHATVVPLEELPNWEGRRAMISVTLPLKHIDARETMAAFSTMVDQQVTQVRHVASANLLTFTGPAQVVISVVRHAQSFDVANESAGIGRIAQLEERLDALERLLAEDILERDDR